MKKLEILGPGCPKCEKLAEMTRKAAEELGIEFELIKIKEIAEIVSRGVMLTPGLSVDGQLKSVGKVPSVGEIKSMIQ